jgi:hypothetical protein
MHRDDFKLETAYDEVYTEAYTSPGIPTPPASTTPAKTLPMQPVFSQNNQEAAKKENVTVKDWIRLPFIDTPFKARMAAVLIVELIYNLTRDQSLRDLVLKEIRTNNRLNRK